MRAAQSEPSALQSFIHRTAGDQDILHARADYSSQDIGWTERAPNTDPRHEHWWRDWRTLCGRCVAVVGLEFYERSIIRAFFIQKWTLIRQFLVRLCKRGSHLRRGTERIGVLQKRYDGYCAFGGIYTCFDSPVPLH